MIRATTPRSFSGPLPAEVDVVVVGAGIVGTATAWFLARDGISVLLCEKGRVAAEQSSRNWGWIRQQGRDPAELPIMMESNRIWRTLERDTGETDLAFTTSGCLYLASTERELAKFETWHEVARQHQLDTRMLTPREAAAMSGIEGEVAGGMFTPSDGRAEPLVAAPALARDARRRGAAVMEDCAVRSVEVSAGRVSAVWTEHGRVGTATVVLAGGAWSTDFASNTGFYLPQLMVRSTAGRTHPVEGPDLPNLSGTGIALRRRADGGYTVSTGDYVEHYVGPRSFRELRRFVPLMRTAGRDIHLRPGPPSGYPGAWGARGRWDADEKSPFERMRVLDPPASPVVHRRMERNLRRLAPWLAKVGLAEVWAGMIDVTPDAVPYMCEVLAPRGLVLATGMSGHGFGFGPGAGRVMADLVQGRTTGHDLSRFRFERFSDGSPIVPGPY